MRVRRRSSFRRQRLVGLCAAGLLLVLLGACATHRRFAPRENQNGTGPTGRPAAVYPLVNPDGKPLGEVRLWSDGGEISDGSDGLEQTRIHIGFELENATKAVMQLDVDEVFLSGLLLDDQPPATTAPALDPVTQNPLPLASVPARAVVGDATAGPLGTARIEFEFTPASLDAGVEVTPRSIRGFDISWTVTVGDQEVRQVTPFLPFFPEPVYWDHGPWYGFHPGWRRYCW